MKKDKILHIIWCDNAAKGGRDSVGPGGGAAISGPPAGVLAIL